MSSFPLFCGCKSSLKFSTRGTRASNANALTYIRMSADYSDDSDEELGAYIYSISRTAQLLREEAARNNQSTTNNDNNDDNITMPKRKSPHKVEKATYLYQHQNQNQSDVRKRR